MQKHIESVIVELRSIKSDRTDVEVKSAAGGFPDSLVSTLSALANLPGGGTVILGLDEANNFNPVTLGNPTLLKQALASRARHYVPPVQLTIDEVIIDDKPVVVATVHECNPAEKPCKDKTTGRSWLRGYDGDYELSELEHQAFLASRTAPMSDRLAVEGTTKDDLDEELLATWTNSARLRSPDGLGRFTNQDELLRRAGIVDASGTPTVAGILVLGKYPQQFFPRFVIQAAAMPADTKQTDTRASNVTMIDGPIPVMLDSAIAWAARTFRSQIVGSDTGHVRDAHEYPLEAFRELVANALVHRELGSWAQGFAVELRLYKDRLIISNPGGLYGLTVDRLGLEHVTSARNARVVDLCQDARGRQGENRVIEALASGIPQVARSLEAFGLPSAKYFDVGIRFTVMLRQPKTTAEESSTPPSVRRGSKQELVLLALSDLTLSVADLAKATGLSETSVATALRVLRDQHDLIIQHGGRGKVTTYEQKRHDEKGQ